MTETQSSGRLMQSQLIGKTLMGKAEGRREKEMTENKMVEWRHQVNGREFEQVPEVVKDRETGLAAVHGFADSWAIE